MATLYWVGGTGTWGTLTNAFATTSGGTGTVTATTANDDVFFDGATGVATITLSANKVCRSLTCTGFTGTFSMSGSSTTLAIGNASGGALTLAAGMTLTLVTSPIFNFVSTSNNSGTGWPITSAGKTMPAMTFNGTGGKWQLQDTIVGSSTITLTSGTLDTNSQTIQTTGLVSSGSTTRTLTLGSSAITSSSTTITGFNFNFTGLTMTANTATFTFTGAGAGMTITTLGGNFNGLSLVFTGSGAHTTNGSGLAFTVGGFSVAGTAVKTDSMTFAQDITVAGNLSLTGQSAINRLFVSSATLGTTATITVSGTVTLTSVDLTDITGAGSAWGGTSVGDAQGNTGITFTTPATQTFASGTKNWSDVTAWTSRVPLPQDDVVISTTTASTLTVDMPRLGHSLDFTGYTRTWALSGSFTIYGNVTLASGMTFSGSGSPTLAGRSAQTYKSNGKTFAIAAGNNIFTIHALTGSYTLQDNSIFTQGSVNGSFRILSGTFNMNGFTLNTSHFNSSTTTWPRTLTTGGGTINITGTDAATRWQVASANLTFTTPPNVTQSALSTNAWTFTGGGMAYGTFTYTAAGSTGALTISDGNTFDTFNFSDTTNARTLTMTGGTVTTINTAFNVNGTSGKLMTITSASSHILSKPSGSVSVDFVSLTNSIATGGASWAAGPNSVDGGGNQGWVINGTSTGGNTAGNMFEIF